MRAKIGYIATHENHAPEVLLENSVLAAKAGFDTIWNSDHFHPWGHTGGNAGFSWIWMAALAERTDKLPIGTAVTAPGYRYHPAIIAQAFATLGRLYPGRIILGLGLGESLNEYPLGYAWPGLKERVERFEECIEIIRLLWSEDFVDFQGRYYQLKKANLYTRPTTPVPMYIASQGPRVSSIAGKYADGYIFSVNAHDIGTAGKLYREVCRPAVERAAVKAGRDPKSIEHVGTVFVSYDENYEKAVNGASFWRGSFGAGGALTNELLSDPRYVESVGKKTPWEKIAKQFIISTDAEDHIKALQETIRLGFDEVAVTSTSPDEKKFLEFYSKKVIPHVKAG